VIRTGIGYDAHRLVAGRELVLGGVGIPHDRGLEGHSDADVLAHAVADALLGAAGLPDLGELYPASDPRYARASSLALLAEVAGLLAGRGLRVVNVDAVVVADAPRLGPHREGMRANLARALGLPVERVSVKPKSSEGLGFAGRGEGMAALATALVEGADGG
jgi:2-C-methyl-D-erythritol 2,4-cyclodiphosphate synthase